MLFRSISSVMFPIAAFLVRMQRTYGNSTPRGFSSQATRFRSLEPYLAFKGLIWPSGDIYLRFKGLFIRHIPSMSGITPTSFRHFHAASTWASAPRNGSRSLETTTSAPRNGDSIKLGPDCPLQHRVILAVIDFGGDIT